MSVAHGKHQSPRNTKTRNQMLYQQPHLLPLHPKQLLQLSLTQHHSLTTSSVKLLKQTLALNQQVQIPPCSTSFVRSRHAAPASWTVALAWALSVLSTLFSCSLRPLCADGACSSAASRFGFPQRRPLLCRHPSPRRLLRL